MLRQESYDDTINVGIGFKNEKPIHFFTYLYQRKFIYMATYKNFGISFKNKKTLFYIFMPMQIYIYDDSYKRRHKF